MDLVPPFSTRDLQAGRVRCRQADGNLAWEQVRLYGVQDATRTLVGFGITYGWDGPADLIREVDLALPVFRGHLSTAPLEAITRLVDRCFRVEGAIEARGQTRTGLGGSGFAPAA